MSYPRTADEELIALEKRSISQASYIQCAICGEKTKVTNRFKVPWSVMDLDNGLVRINFVCGKNGCEYDIATCCKI